MRRLNIVDKSSYRGRGWGVIISSLDRKMINNVKLMDSLALKEEGGIKSLENLRQQFNIFHSHFYWNKVILWKMSNKQHKKCSIFLIKKSNVDSSYQDKNAF